MPQEKLDQYLRLVYFIFDGPRPTPVESVTKPGLYIVHASYMEKAPDGSLAAAGNGSMFLFFSENVKGFSVSDNTVEYDGRGHFATVTDTNSPALTTASVIVDKAEKQINILLPERIDTLEEIFASVNGDQFEQAIKYLELYSPENTVIQFVRELLRQAAADIAHTTGYTIAINADLPSEPGEYHIYVAASGQPVKPSDSKTASAAMLERALLTITPSKPVISLQNAQDLSKVYDGKSLADPVKGTDYTINGAYRGNESITWYLQTADGPVAVDAPTDVGSYNVTITLEATEWNEAASASLSGITITPKDIAGADVALVEKLTYNGSEQTQNIASVTVDGLAAAYTVSGNTGTEAGDYVLTVHGTGNFTGMAEKEFSIARKDIAEAVITLEYTSVMYDGDVQKPAVVSAAVDGIQMLENNDFTVSYAGNTDPGVAQVILNGKNNFTGTASTTFVIYRENEYTVVVTGGQGSGAYKAGEAVTITADVPAGYEFIRWKGIEGLQFIYGSSEMPTAVFSMPARHVIIAAEYGMIQPQTFTVRFSAGSGSGYMADVSVTAGEYRLPACAFTAPAGQQFSRWQIGSAEYNPGDTIMVGADTFVTAVWKQLPVPGSAPVILSPTQAQKITLSVGGRATLAITAQGARSYQWYVDRGDGQGPVAVPGAVAAAYITPPAVIDDDSSVYFCVVKNEYGFVQSVPFRLTVQPQAVVPTTGDNAPLAVWCVMLLGSLIGFALICRRGESARRS